MSSEVSSANTFGTLFSLHTFGESHGAALGCVVSGVPAGVVWDQGLLVSWLERRRPGGAGTSARRELDTVEVLSGVFDGKTIGTPIAMITRNQDARPDDYKSLAPRAGHADDVWQVKFGHRDPRGGGRSSGRETVSRVMGAAVAEMLSNSLAPQSHVFSFLEVLGPHRASINQSRLLELNRAAVDAYPARFPNEALKQNIVAQLDALRERGESWGGVVCVVIKNPSSSLGQPVFRKFKSDLAQALLTIGAVNGVEFGSGFEAAQQNGTEFHGKQGFSESGGYTQSVYGGIRGGITTGETVVMRVSFKPTSSILDVAKRGRHDPCVAIRASVVCEAMVQIVLAEHLLWRRLDRLDPSINI